VYSSTPLEGTVCRCHPDTFNVTMVTTGETHGESRTAFQCWKWSVAWTGRRWTAMVKIIILKFGHSRVS